MLSALPPTVILKKTSFKRDKTKRYDKISKRLRLERKMINNYALPKSTTV